MYVTVLPSFRNSCIYLEKWKAHMKSPIRQATRNQRLTVEKDLFLTGFTQCASPAPGRLRRLPLLSLDSGNIENTALTTDDSREVMWCGVHVETVSRGLRTSSHYAAPRYLLYSTVCPTLLVLASPNTMTL